MLLQSNMKVAHVTGPQKLPQQDFGALLAAIVDHPMAWVRIGARVLHNWTLDK